MTVPLRMLNVEDSEDDALLLVRYLSRAGYAVTAGRVDTAEAMRKALAAGPWDVVVADYTLPSFSAPAALALLKECGSTVPVVIISGIVADDIMGMEALRNGAKDYLAKTYLSRLVPAIVLAAGVMAPAERPAAHLALCQEYLRLPEPNMAKAAAHGEQALMGAQALGDVAVLVPAILALGETYLHLGWAGKAVETFARYAAVRGQAEDGLEGWILLQQGLALEQTGERSGAGQSLQRAQRWFEARGQEAEARECARHLVRLLPSANGKVQALAESEFEGHLARGEYHLLAGKTAEAVKEAIAALNEAGADSLRSYSCYSLLMRCARVQGHQKDGLNFALCARMMALEARRYDLAFQAAQAFEELFRDLGPRSHELLAELTGEYRRLGVNIAHYVPESMGRV
jgi:CheY-like chemotaxis protein